MELNYTTEIYDNELDWLQARMIGGSSASAVLDLNPYMTKTDLWKEIISKLENKETKQQQLLKIKKGKKNKVLEYGHKAEPLIRKIVQLNLKDEYKFEAPKGYVLYRRKDKPYLTATVDSLITRLIDGLKGVHEIKTRECRTEAEYNEWAYEKKIPQNYFIQMLHYFVVMNDREFIYLSPKLIQRMRKGTKWKIDKETLLYGLIIWRKEVQKQVDYLEKKETEFWENNILKRQIPTIEFKEGEQDE